MDKPSPVNHRRFEVLAQSCLRIWERYFTDVEVHQHVLELAKRLDCSEDTEQARLLTIDSHLLELKEHLSPTKFSQTLTAFSPLCQFFKERGALTKNPFVFAEDSSVAVVAIHQNPPPEVLKGRIKEHLDHRVSAGKLVSGSVSSYKSDLNQFFTFIIERGLDLTVDAIEQYALSLANEQPNSATYKWTTIARKKNSLRAYLRVEIKRKTIQLGEDYDEYLITRKKDRTPQNPYTPLNLEEICLLLKHIATLDLRAQLEILLPLLLGPRAEEVVDLQVKHFNFLSGHLDLLETKNGLTRSVPMPDFIEQILKDYIKLAHLSHSDYLFPGMKLEPICPKTLTEHVKKAIKAAGIKRPATCHNLRATYANLQLFHNNTAVFALQILMGHVDPATTLKYARDVSQRTPPLTELYRVWSRLFYPNSSTPSQESTDITALYYYPPIKRQMGASNSATMSSEPIRPSIFRVVK